MSRSHTIPLMLCLLLSATALSNQSTPAPQDQSYTPSLQEVLASPQPVDYITKPEVSADVQTPAERDRKSVV